MTQAPQPASLLPQNRTVFVLAGAHPLTPFGTIISEFVVQEAAWIRYMYRAKNDTERNRQ